jgi:hypothetical protein
MRRFALLLVAAFLLSGCTVLSSQHLEPAPETLTHGRLVYLADRACGRAFGRLPKIEPGLSYRELNHRLHRLVRTQEHLLFVLHGLPPSAADVAAYRQLLASFNYEDLLQHNFLQAFEEADVRHLRTYARRIQRFAVELRLRARSLGMHICAKY